MVQMVMEARPPHLRFLKVALEDRNATLEAGHAVYIDVDHVAITPVGSRDSVTKMVKEWLEQTDQQVNEERLPASWADKFRSAYEHWKRGEELPVDGTALANWPAITPGELASCKSVHVLTVEALAQANDETTRRLGLGGLELKKRALRFLDAAHNGGKLVAENTDLRAKLEASEQRRQELEDRVVRLEQLVPGAKSPVVQTRAASPVEDKVN